ncbi:MAG: ParA family protein [Bacteroidota bacterium]
MVDQNTMPEDADLAPAEATRPVIVTVFNQKGGVGKTTTAVNVAICLAAFGRQVALIDLDSQSNATSNLGVPPPVATGAYHLITGQVPFVDCLRATPFENLRLVGGSDELAWADIELAMGEQPEAAISRALAVAPAGLDFIVVDCPPAPGIVSVNALVAADMVVMPVMPSPHALDGLHKAWWNVTRVRSHFKRDMSGLHILLTMTEDGDVTKRLSADIIAEFGTRVMPIMVPRDGAVIEAAARDLPVAVLSAGSAPARAYVRVAELLLDPATNDLAAREAARERLDQWQKRLGELPAHRDRYGNTGAAPDTAWTDQGNEDADDADIPPPPVKAPRRSPRPSPPAAPVVGWGRRLVLWLLLVAIGAVLGAAATVAVLKGPELPFPV